MGKFTLVLFPDEKRACRGLSALQALHREGSIAVRGAALIERDEHGLLLLKKDSNGMLLESGLGAIVARAPSDLLGFVARDLAPRNVALIAELWGEWISPIDALMQPLGGRVVRE